MDSEGGSRVDLGTEIDEDEDHGKFLYPGHIDVKIIPQVRKCDLLHFKNRFNAAEKVYTLWMSLQPIPLLKRRRCKKNEGSDRVSQRIRRSQGARLRSPLRSCRPKAFNIHIETIPKHPHQTVRGQVRFTDPNSISYNPVDIIQDHARVLGQPTSDVRSALQPSYLFSAKGVGIS
jgi:hypothetical protein